MYPKAYRYIRPNFMHTHTHTKRGGGGIDLSIKHFFLSNSIQYFFFSLSLVCIVMTLYSVSHNQKGLFDYWIFHSSARVIESRDWRLEYLLFNFFSFAIVTTPSSKCNRRPKKKKKNEGVVCIFNALLSLSEVIPPSKYTGVCVCYRHVFFSLSYHK